jgi:hypothetical protein
MTMKGAKDIRESSDGVSSKGHKPNQQIPKPQLLEYTVGRILRPPGDPPARLSRLS